MQARRGCSWRALLCILTCLLVLGNVSLDGAEPSRTSLPATTLGDVTVVAFEGTVEFLRLGATNWSPVTPNLVLRPRDLLRTGNDGRASYRVGAGPVTRMRSGSVLEVKARVDRPGTLINLLRGFFHFFDREGSLEVEIRDGLASAASLGTDFAIAVDEFGQTDVAVFDGRVTLRNATGAVELSPGELGRATPGAFPSRTRGLPIESLVQWTWYYPLVLDPAELPLTAQERTQLAPSLDAYRQGAMLEALKSWPAGAPTSEATRAFLAALRLGIGESTDAPTPREPEPSLTSDPAMALTILVAATRGDPIPPTPSSPQSASLLLARSYAAQAQRDLPAALSAAREARTRAPHFGPAWAREAELLFSEGRLDEANEALDRALSESPRLVSALALRGFLLAAANRIPAALEAFDAALAVDNGFANAWLGRGLVRIRRGDLAAGRDDLLVAAALEPRRSILRSYLGKAYSDRGDRAAADRELRLARELDPRDPTAWLYSALAHSLGNRVNEAIADLERAKQENDNRSVYRSRLLLDEDRAVKSANLARLYHDAGMPDVAQREAIQALAVDPISYASHLFLANSLNELRDPNLVNLRYESATVSEYLLANLLSPVPAGTLSPTLSQQEYGKLFERNRHGIVSETEYRSSGDWFQSASVFGQYDRSAIALEGAYIDRNGERPNNDFELRSLAAQSRLQLTPTDTLFFRVQTFRQEGGDLRQLYDPEAFDPTFRYEETRDVEALAGVRHVWSPQSQTLLLVGGLRNTFDFDSRLMPSVAVFESDGVPEGAVGFTIDQQVESALDLVYAEAQQLLRTGPGTWIAGVRIQGGQNRVDSFQDGSESIMAPIFYDPVTFEPIPADNREIRPDLLQIAGYLYYQHWFGRRLALIGGMAYENLEYPANPTSSPVVDGQERVEAWLPKIGMLAHPWDGATIRAAYFQSLSGGGLATSYRLEPTTVAGFVQQYRSLLPESLSGANPGAHNEGIGLSLEQVLPSRTYLGVALEHLESDVDEAIGTFLAGIDHDPPVTGSTGQTLDYRERSLVATVNQLLGDRFSLGARYRVARADLELDRPALRASLPPDAVQDVALSSEQEATLHQVILSALFNHPLGVFAGTEGVWWSQSSESDDLDAGSENFWHWNARVGYRLPRRRLEASVGLLNILDQDYRLNPLTYMLAPPRERTLVLQLRLSF